MRALKKLTILLPGLFFAGMLKPMILSRCQVYEPKNYDYLQEKTRNLLYRFTESAPFLRDYSLVGGSALALYLCHRKSEDLDFFTFADTFDKQTILGYCKDWGSLKILNESDEQLDLLMDGVKVTFFNARWSFLQPVEP